MTMRPKHTKRSLRRRRARGLGAVALSAALALSAFGCAPTGAGGAAEDAGGGTDRAAQHESAFFDVSTLDLEFSRRDMDPSYDEATATKVALSDAGTSVEGAGVRAEGSVVTLSAEGTYVVSGELTNGGLVVDAGDEDKVQLVLADVRIHNETGPAICVENADKCFLTLAEGTDNALSDGATYDLAGDDDNRDAVVFSRDDLTVNGTGSLEVTGSYKHGICSNDDLRITGGTLNVTSKEDAFRGKDCIKVADGAITVDAGDDAFHSDAFFYAKGGTVNVVACYEGYEGEQVIIDGGEHTIAASDDALNAALADSEGADSVQTQGDAPSPREGDMPGDAGQQAAPDVRGGMRQQDGALPDGAALSDVAGAADGGNPSAMDATPSREGGLGSDDAGADGRGAFADDADGKGTSGKGASGSGAAADGRGGFGGMATSSESCLIQINGGTVTLAAAFDAIDSNGNVEINGGTVLVSGPDKGMDGALDYDLRAQVNGGTVLMAGSVGSTSGLDASAQPVMLAQVAGSVGDEVVLADADGNVLAAVNAAYGFSTLLVSSPAVAEGASFSVTVGGEAFGLTMERIDAPSAAGAGRGAFCGNGAQGISV